jgi:hypothetical protein
MGAYENPAMIQGPDIGKIWGQAFASLGQSIGQGVASGLQQYYSKLEEAKKEQKAENARVQQIGYEIEERAYDQANENYNALKRQNPGLAEQFQPMVANLLNGTGVAGEEGYKMGAIEAQTLLATKSNLSKEEKEYYRNIVQRAKLFQDRVISGGADIISDLSDMEKIKPQDIGNTHYYVGNNAKEKLTSQYSAYVLNNKEIPGATTSKNLGIDNDGNPIVSVSTVFDASSTAGKALLKKFPELESEIKNGQISFKWEKDITQLGDGFIREIPAGIDATQVYQDSGAMDDQGKLTQNMLIGNPIMRREASGAKGIDNLIETQYLNVPGLMQSKTFNAAAKAKATAIISYDPGDLKAYMQNTLELGPKYDYSSFMKKSAEEKISILQELEKQKLIKTKFSGYKSRPATAEDVKYINANAKDLQSGESLAPIQEGQMIYYQEEAKGISEYQRSGGGGSTGDKATTISKDRWEGMKESGYSKGSYKYKWNNALGGFEQYFLSSIDGIQNEEKVSGVLARSPQELGNISGGQNWGNPRGFEIQEPELITQNIIGPINQSSGTVNLDEELNTQ